MFAILCRLSLADNTAGQRSLSRWTFAWQPQEHFSATCQAVCWGWGDTDKQGFAVLPFWNSWSREVGWGCQGVDVEVYRKGPKVNNRERFFARIGSLPGKLGGLTKVVLRLGMGGKGRGRSMPGLSPP